MYALTIRQPWTQLVAANVKRIENRTWATGVRGSIAIHAAKKPDELDAATIEELKDRGIVLPPAAKLVYGAVIGIVDLVDCVPYEQLPAALADDPFASPGAICWIFSNARMVDPPFRIGGKLGLWEFDESLLKPLARPPTQK
jgi:activating signal cointegrator 1